MKDFSLLFLVAKKLLEAYYEAMISQNKAKAYRIANEFVEVALKLEDIAHAD